MNELLVLEMLLMLLEQPTDSIIEVAVSLAKETGVFLQDVAPAPANQCGSPPPHTAHAQPFCLIHMSDRR